MSEIILTPSMILKAVAKLEAEQTTYAKTRDYTAKQVWRAVKETRKEAQE